MNKKIQCLLLALISYAITMAQSATDTLNSMPAIPKAKDSGAIELLKRDGKIYTVVAVLVFILLSIFFYLWRLDRKIQKLGETKK
jgi:Na+/H+-translocating membrane pyrophosphatase